MSSCPYTAEDCLSVVDWMYLCNWHVLYVIVMLYILYCIFVSFHSIQFVFINKRKLCGNYPVWIPGGINGSPPYRLVIQRQQKGNAEYSKDTITVMSYKALNMGPYPEDQPQRNTVRYTPTQVEAIRAD
jgi:hypothetical protein